MQQKGADRIGQPLYFRGRDDWIRTSDFCVPNAALYQAEPRPDYLTRISHKSSAPTADMSVLLGVLGARYPATYFSSTPRMQPPAVSRWHAHLHGLATPIREICGLV